MAVVYFTSNASTGAGSLVEAIANAQPGDVVRPDETVFERGATIEIALASTLNVDKNLTLDGGPFRVALNGGSVVRCVFVVSGATASFTSFDFIGGATSSSGGGIYVDASATLVLTRCRVAGCAAGSGGGGIYSRGAVALNDCVATGCVARSANGGGISSTGALVLDGSTVVGNSTGASGADVRATATLAATNSILGDVSTGSATAPDYLGCIVNVVPSQIGFVAPPPDDLSVDNWNANAWRSWDLRLLDDASPNPSPYRDAGNVGAMSRYDLDGNFRGRETNSIATCSPGAYETIQADLFWVGKDASGATVATPSFLSADGWAASRFATVSGDAVPQIGQTFFVGVSADFADAAPENATIVVGATSVVVPTLSGEAIVGASRGVAFGGVALGLKLGAFAQLTTRGTTTLPFVEFADVGTTVDGISTTVYDGIFFAAAAPPANVTFSENGGWADTRANVTAIDVDPTSATTVAIKIVKSDATVAAFAQYSDDDGATWRTVETVADVDEYDLTVAQGADVVVRVATATGWLTDTVSTAPFLPVWTVLIAFESIVGVVHAFEIATGGSNTGNNSYKLSGWGTL